MKIGVYGGTFNPPHLGHLISARFAMEALGLDRLIFMPAGDPPHKELPQGSPTARERLAMVELAADSMLLPGRVDWIRDVIAVRKPQTVEKIIESTCARRIPNREP